jgi:hypothetical protein
MSRTWFSAAKGHTFMNDNTVRARSVRLWASLFVVLLFGGCITYSPQELSAMPDISLCELQLYSLVNLEEGTKRGLQDELSRRKADCRAYVTQLEAERAEKRARAMYGCM